MGASQTKPGKGAAPDPEDVYAARLYEYEDKGRVETQMVKVGHRDISFKSCGKQGLKPVVLLHGQAFDAYSFQFTGVLEALADAGFRAFAPDLPGCGQNPSKNPSGTQMHSGAERSTFVTEFVDAVGIPGESKVMIVAASFGGEYGLPFVEDNPSRTAGYVSVAASLEPEKEACDVPGLVIFGENDKRRKMGIPEKYNDYFTSATTSVYPGAKHPAYLYSSEIAARFCQDLTSFAKGTGDFKYSAAWA